MPAEKYGFSLPGNEFFGHLIIHSRNPTLCCAPKFPAPRSGIQARQTDGKDKLVAALKASFEFCTTALPT